MDRVTKPQKKMLISLLRETKYMEGKKEKEWYWEKIQAALNTIGPKKTIIQWKKCWRDMRLTTRKKLAEMKRCQLAGGSPPPGIELNQEDNDIIDIVGSEYFYEEMGGELKPENFMTGFEYVPEQFCDAILSAAAVSSGQTKDAGHPVQDGHEPDGTDAAGSSGQEHQHGSNFSGPAVGVHNGESNGTGGHHPAFPGISAATVAACGHQHMQHRRREAAAAAAAAAIHRESAFEEKLLQLMQDTFSKKDRKRKKRDPDKLFLLSLYEEMKKVPEDTRLDVKAELIQVLKRFQKKGAHKSNTDKSLSTKQLQSTDKMQRQDAQQMHPQQQHPHSMYQLQKKYEKNVEKGDQQQTTPSSQQQVEAQQRQQQQHSQQTRDSNDPQRMHTQQQIPHNLFQMQKKYTEDNDKVHQQQQQQQQQQQNDQQRKQLVDTQPHPHQQAQQPPAPPPPTSNNDQHLHHPQMPHGIMFPLAQIRNEHPHQQQQQQQPHSHQHHQHHPAPLFTATPPSAMTGDRSMTYENVG